LSQPSPPEEGDVEEVSPLVLEEVSEGESLLVLELVSKEVSSLVLLPLSEELSSEEAFESPVEPKERVQLLRTTASNVDR
jgi:hypothetical protein